MADTAKLIDLFPTTWKYNPKHVQEVTLVSWKYSVDPPSPAEYHDGNNYFDFNIMSKSMPRGEHGERIHLDFRCADVVAADKLLLLCRDFLFTQYCSKIAHKKCTGNI